MGNGDGGYLVVSTNSTDAGPIDIKTADINGDDNIDIIIANNLDSSITLYLGNGIGQFTRSSNITVTAGVK